MRRPPKARYAHRAAPRVEEVWTEVRRRHGRRGRRTVRIISVDATHAEVRNITTGRLSWISLSEFTHGVVAGWRRQPEVPEERR